MNSRNITLSLSPSQQRFASGLLWGIGGGALGLGVGLNHGIIGVALFAACASIATLLTSHGQETRYDDRHKHQHNQASGQTLTIFGVASAVLFPFLTLLHSANIYTWPTWLTPIAFFIPVLYITYAIVKYRLH